MAPARILHLKQLSTLCAAKIGPRLSARNPAPAPKTAQLMQVIVHNSLVLAYQCTAIPAVDRVVSQSESVAKGHDFSRADQGKNITGALAPASVFGMKVSDRRKAAC